MTSFSRRTALLAAVAAVTLGTAGAVALAQGLPPMKQKATYKVGFAQTESNNPWRLAQTASMQDEAKKLGWQLVYTDAAGSAAKQVADVEQHDRAGRRRDLPAAARGEAADPGRHGRQEGRHPGGPARPQRRPEPGQARPGLRHLHRLGLRRGRPARRRMAGQGDRRQGQDHRARGHDRFFARPTTARRASTSAIKAGNPA